MSLTFAIAIYVICWWVVLFTVLPIGVRTQQEEGHVIPGTAESAPASPNLGYKLFLTTVISAFVFMVVYVVVVYSLISI